MKKVILLLIVFVFLLICSCTDHDKLNIQPEIKNRHIEVTKAEFDSLSSLTRSSPSDSIEVFYGIKFGYSKDIVENKLQNLFLKGVLSLDLIDYYTFTFNNKDGSSMIGSISTNYFNDKLYQFNMDIDVESANSKVVWRNVIQYIENLFDNYYYMIDSEGDDWNYYFIENNLRGFVMESRYSITVFIYDWEQYIEKLSNRTKK